MNRVRFLLMMVLLAPLYTQADDLDEPGDTDEPPAIRELRLDQVPEAAVRAARDEKPGVFFDSAERIIWRDEPVYQINGAKGREIWRVYVNVQGTVLRVERDVREGRDG